MKNKDDQFHKYCNDCNKLIVEWFVDYDSKTMFGNPMRGRFKHFDDKQTVFYGVKRCGECSEKLNNFILEKYYG